MPFSKGKFGPHSTSEKGPKPGPEVSKSMDKTKELVHGKAQAPHSGGGTEEHVTKTAPGTTEPHPVTGVHAISIHHNGGGKYTSHTHHDGGEVETRQHGSAGEAHQAAQEALPSEGQGNMESADRLPDEGFGDSLGGIGGNMPVGG